MNRKGFTLAELLIVVAIIAVLVAIGIPIFNSQVEKSREATDIANMRSARSVISTAFMSGDIEAGSLEEYYYDGTGLSLQIPSVGYGKGTSANGKTIYDVYNGCEQCNYDAKVDHKDDFLMASVALDGTVHVHWGNAHLDIEVALPELDPNWVSWTMTDSRGLGGSATRKQVLNALGLSDNHEYTFTTAKDGSNTYVVYIYNGNFPDYAKKGNSAQLDVLNSWMENSSSKDINVSVFTYDTNTKETTYSGQQTANAVLRNRNGECWIQIQPK